MGEREVDQVIEQWRASARAAGESAAGRHDDDDVRPGGGWLHRIGPFRVVAAVLAVIVFGAIAVPVLSGGEAPPDAGEAAPVPAAPSTAPAVEPADAGTPRPVSVDDWFGLLQAVDRARQVAYATSDPAGLATVFDPAGPALAREQRAISALQGAGVTAQGWRTELLAVSPVASSAEQASLRVRDRRAAYQLVDAAGVSTPVAAADESSWLVQLARHDGSWLVVDVLPDVTSPPGQP